MKNVVAQVSENARERAKAELAGKEEFTQIPYAVLRNTFISEFVYENLIVQYAEYFKSII